VRDPLQHPPQQSGQAAGSTTVTAPSTRPVAAAGRSQGANAPTPTLDVMSRSIHPGLRS